MTLARSASVPGGLSINTGAANLLGSSSTQSPAAGGSLFTTATSTQAPAPATTMASTGGGLFGIAKPGGIFGTSTTAATTQPQQTGGLFGQPAATAAQPAQTSGGMFGQPAGTSQPAQPGSLFGQSVATRPAQSGGVFGQPAAAQPAPTGGLFGQSAPAARPFPFGSSITAQPQQQQQTPGLGGSLIGGGGLFGNIPPQQSSSPFAQTQQQSSAGFGLGGTKSLFGTSASTPGPGLTMGQAGAAATTVPGVRIDLSNIKGTTRFNDLQEDLQKEITKIDTLIQSCMEQKNQVAAFMPAHGEQIEAIPSDVRFVQRKYDGAAGALHGDAQTIKGLREQYKVDVENAKLSWKAVDNLKLPAQYHTSGLWSTKGGDTNGDGEGGGSSDLINFFSRTGSEMEETLKKFGGNLSEIESHMHGVQGNLLEQLQRISAANGFGGIGGAEEKVAELAAVLREFEASILQVAGTVGSAREEMTELQLGQFMRNGR